MQVEELLERENIRYRSAGKDVLVHCMNPAHEDNNPSMRIDKLTGLFNCFSCGFKGNIYTHFGESVDTLGIKVLQLKDKIAKILRNEMLLPLGAEDFKRDYRGISGKTYEKFGAFIHDNYEDRVVFPIRDITGKLIALLGRYVFSDANPKYFIDPPHSNLPIYPPKPEIYKDSVILVEGIFDVLNLYDKGMTNVVCAFGKSLGETKKRAKRAENLQKFIPLKLQGIKRIFILYDKGALPASDKLARLLDGMFVVESIDYPNFSKDKDAGNLTQEEVDELRDFIYDENRISRQIQ